MSNMKDLSLKIKKNMANVKVFDGQTDRIKSKKIMANVKVFDGQTEGQTDRQTEGRTE